MAFFEIFVIFRVRFVFFEMIDDVSLLLKILEFTSEDFAAQIIFISFWIVDADFSVLKIFEIFAVFGIFSFIFFVMMDVVLVSLKIL